MKNLLRYSLIIALLSSIFAGANAQIEKISLALEDGNLKRALKLAETYEEDPQYKKNPELYFLKAEALYRIMEDPFLGPKTPDALKMGIKAIEKGRYKGGGEILPEYSKLVDNYVVKNNEKGASEYKINKYTGAIKTYEKSFSLNGDMIAKYWVGKCQLLTEDTVLGEESLNMVINWSNEENAEGNEVDEIVQEAYIYFADKHWLSKQYDSASMYLESARRVFGGNTKIDYFQKEVTKEQIKQLPPSTLMMEKIKHMLSFFPTDTFFVKKENALYLYLLRNHFNNRDTAKLDTMLAHFTAEKVARSASKRVNQYKKSDQFIDAKAENVLWKLVKYYSKFNHRSISNYIAHQYMVSTTNGENPEDVLARYTVIIDYASKSHSLYLANQLLDLAESIYGNSPEVDGIRNSLISKSMGTELDLQDEKALYGLMVKSKPNLASADEETMEFYSAHIDRLIKNKDYIDAKKLILTHMTAQPEHAIWHEKIDYLAKEDFYHSYYMTRVKDEMVAGTKVNGYEWNGSRATCDAGDIEASIQKKVENRINYFRRQAGLNEIYLDPELNDWCQKAALMMESNKSLSHEPDSRWSCYSDEGAHAARYSLLTKGATTTMAVTSFFADNKNPSVGNRRWLLYPNGAALGHGSTANACAIWALDDSGSVDTNKYKEQFVAWPPEGITPRMMFFNFWSFSIKQDLKGAKVTMEMGGSDIPVEQFDLVDGYGMPTLVWKPGIDIKTITEKTALTVVVELANGRRYEYDVMPLDFDPVGY